MPPLNDWIRFIFIAIASLLTMPLHNAPVLGFAVGFALYILMLSFYRALTEK